MLSFKNWSKGQKQLVKKICSKKIWLNKKLGQKFFWCNKEWSKTILDENEFLVQINFMSKEMLGLKNLDKRILFKKFGQKILVKTNFRSKNNLSKEIG